MRARIKIRVAENSGFCFGVDRSVKIVYNELSKGKKTVTFGEIIHNASVVNDLKNRGVLICKSEDELKRISGETVIIRSHGAARSVYEILDRHNIEYVDGTCPFVKRIHKIAAEKSADGFDIIIFGDRNHPEITGIAGQCHNIPFIYSDDTDFLNNYKINHKNLKKKVAIVVQTTYNINMWEKCVLLAEDIFPQAEVYNTICGATAERQHSALSLSKFSDLMIIIGGRHSSNTAKLYQICEKQCKTCFHITDASELDFEIIRNLINNAGEYFNIGITAGASTPAYIIKEVQNQMTDKLQNIDEDFNFEEALDASFKRIYTGNRVKGYITAVNNSEAIVDVGTKHTGYVSLSELTNDPNLKPSDVVNVGDEVDLIVVKINDAEGIVQLSKTKVDAMVGFDTVMKAKEDGRILEGVVTNVVKGGIIVLSEGIKIFIPASQATLRRNDNLDDLVKKTVQFKIIEVNVQRGKAVGSIRVAAGAVKETAKAEFWNTAEIGAVYKGAVKSLTNYGAFVDLGGIDGMVHISELSWNRIKHPSEVLSVGDVAEVYIKELDRETGRISLGYRKTDENPWVKFENEYAAGDTVKAKIVSITPFGAFAQIIPGIDGLIHISQLSEKRVTNVKDIVSVGDEVEARITEIDAEKKRISMSIRAVAEEYTEENTDTEASEEEPLTAEEEADENKAAETAAQEDAAAETKEDTVVNETAEAPAGDTSDENNSAG